MRQGGLHVVSDVVFAQQQRRTPSTYGEAIQRARESFQAIHDAVRRCQRDVALARTPDDVERIVRSGKLTVVIGVENGFAIGREHSLLEGIS